MISFTVENLGSLIFILTSQRHTIQISPYYQAIWLYIDASENLLLHNLFPGRDNEIFRFPILHFFLANI